MTCKHTAKLCCTMVLVLWVRFQCSSHPKSQCKTAKYHAPKAPWATMHSSSPVANTSLRAGIGQMASLFAKCTKLQTGLFRNAGGWGGFSATMHPALAVSIVNAMLESKLMEEVGPPCLSTRSPRQDSTEVHTQCRHSETQARNSETQCTKLRNPMFEVRNQTLHQNIGVGFRSLDFGV